MLGSWSCGCRTSHDEKRLRAVRLLEDVIFPFNVLKIGDYGVEIINTDGSGYCNVRVVLR